MAIEAATAAIEGSRPLDAVAKKLTNLFAARVRPGPVKDLLSGTGIGHPLHPLLTDVPIGAWTSALVLDVVGGEPARRAADRLLVVGALAALPTGVTGLSDLADCVHSDERSLGALHALGNVAALSCFLASYAARRLGRRAGGLELSGLGGVLLAGSGFLGGHLAFRKGIGVDETVFLEPPVEWTAVCQDGELADGKPRRVRLAGTDVVLYRGGGGRLYALANRCSHRGGPLHKGRHTDSTLTCPWHLSTFRLDDGAIVRGPATAPQPVYDVRVQNGSIEVRVLQRRG